MKMNSAVLTMKCPDLLALRQTMSVQPVQTTARCEVVGNAKMYGLLESLEIFRLHHVLEITQIVLYTEGFWRIVCG